MYVVLIKIRLSEWLRSLVKFCVITTLVVMHPKLTEQAMKLFACVKVHDRSFLLASISIDCDSAQYRFYSLALGIPFIFICVGIPLFLFYKVFFIKQRYSGNPDHILWSEYAYITRSYRTEVAMWEGVFMIRKMGIAFLSVVLSTRSFEIQTLWGSVWLLIFFALHSEFQPFKFAFINRLENISLLVTLTTFALGGYLGPSDSSRQLDSFTIQWISIATVGINVLFIGYSLVIILYKGLSSLSIAKQLFNRIALCCGLQKCFPKYFQKEAGTSIVVKSFVDNQPTEKIPSKSAQIEITSYNKEF
jgi:hypothetical protein